MNLPYNDQTEEKKPWGMDLKVYCMLMHFSQLTNGLAPGAGLVLPLVMWLTNKDEFPEIDEHGKRIMNWSISSTIYFIISAILMLALVGIVGILIMGILCLLFPIMGGIKAHSGQLWDYPMSIKFFKSAPQDFYVDPIDTSSPPPPSPSSPPSTSDSQPYYKPGDSYGYTDDDRNKPNDEYGTSIH